MLGYELIDQATAGSLENLNSHVSKFYKEQRQAFSTRLMRVAC